MRCDILHLTYSSAGRDVDICEPILSYLEIKYGIYVERACMRDYAEKLYTLRPKIMLTETKGSDTDVNAVRFAKALGIKVVSVTGEGDYVPGKADIFFWGWNKPEYSQPDVELLWSSRARKLIATELPETNESRYNILVSGGTGFDRYKFFSFLKREQFLEKYNLVNYKMIVGFASWGFDVYDYRGDFKFHEKAGIELNRCLRKLIENNKDVLFILKFHPASRNEEKTEFAGLREYKNVIAFHSEENIADLINVSDIWMGYETTTCLEAWLLGKQTLLINPLGADFMRSEIAFGSPIMRNAEEVQNAINEYNHQGRIKAFAELRERRKEIIQDVIEYDDGKNHIRAGEIVYDLLVEKKENGQRDGFNWRMMLLKRKGQKKIVDFVCKFLPGRKKSFPLYSWFNEHYNEEERENQHQKYLRGLKEFYNRYGDNIK